MTTQKENTMTKEWLIIKITEFGTIHAVASVEANTAREAVDSIITVSKDMKVPVEKLRIIRVDTIKYFYTVANNKTKRRNT
jgi:hypothetical protein